MNIPNTSPAYTFTKHKIIKLWHKDEIKFLDMEKETLNNVPYKGHLKAAQEWGKGWYHIEKSINESIGSKYKITKDKLRKLTNN
jgi:hypothetical protein